MVLSVLSQLTAKNLGDSIDSDLNVEKHISNVTRSSFYHLKNISNIRAFLSEAEALVHAFVTSLFSGLSLKSISRLQLSQNAAARILTQTSKTPIMFWF